MYKLEVSKRQFLFRYKLGLSESTRRVLRSRSPTTKMHHFYSIVSARRTKDAQKQPFYFIFSGEDAVTVFGRLAITLCISSNTGW